MTSNQTSQIYFISGHCNLYETEFDTHYKSHINHAMSNKINKFVIGNASGGDTMALNYILSHNYDPKLITIYHKGSDTNHERSIGYYKSLGLNVVTGFKTYTDRDSAMTNASDIDILWIRSKAETKKVMESLGEIYRDSRISGTEKNLIRRQNQNKS